MKSVDRISHHKSISMWMFVSFIKVQFGFVRRKNVKFVVLK